MRYTLNFLYVVFYLNEFVLIIKIFPNVRS